MIFAMIFADVDFPTFVTLPLVRITFICIGEKILFVFWGFVRELEEKIIKICLFTVAAYLCHDGQTTQCNQRRGSLKLCNAGRSK